MALIRTGFAPDRMSTRRAGGVTGAVARALPFPHHTAIDSAVLQHGRITVFTGALPTDVTAFSDWNHTGVFTLRVDQATTPGGAWAAQLRTTDAFLAQHGSLDPATHNQGPVNAQFAVLEYDDLHAVLGSPAWTTSAAAQAQLLAAGRTGIAGPVNITARARNAPGRLTIGSHKHIVATNLATIESLKDAYRSYVSALLAGAGVTQIDGIQVAVRAVGAAAPGNLGHEVAPWPAAHPATAGQSFDQAMATFFAGAEITVVAVFDAGAPSSMAQAAGINVRSTTAHAPLAASANTVAGLGWFVASEWTDNNGNDGINVDALWRSITVTEFQIATPAERPIAAAAGAGAAVDAFDMALDSILGQLAYGSDHDSSPEYWVFEFPAVAAPFVQPANSGSAAVTNAGLAANGLTVASRQVVQQMLDCDLRQSSTVGLAKLGGDHTLGGSDSHLSGIVEKVALSCQHIAEGAAFRWNQAANGGNGAGSRANTTGDRIVCTIYHRARHPICARTSAMFTTGSHPSKGFCTIALGAMAFIPAPSRFLTLRGGFTQLPQVNGCTFTVIREGLAKLMVMDGTLAAVSNEQWWNDVGNAARLVYGGLWNCHSSAAWFVMFTNTGSRNAALTSELNNPLPNASGLDNSHPTVQMLLSFAKEYASKLHPSDKLLNSELVAQAPAPTPQTIALIAALRQRCRTQVSADVATMLANMLGRGAAPIVTVAEAMVAAARQMHVRLNGPLVPPMTVANCPLDPTAQQAAATFWHSILQATYNGGVPPTVAGGIAAATGGAAIEVDNWVAANVQMAVNLWGTGQLRHGMITRMLAPVLRARALQFCQQVLDSGRQRANPVLCRTQLRLAACSASMPISIADADREQTLFVILRFAKKRSRSMRGAISLHVEGPGNSGTGALVLGRALLWEMLNTCLGRISAREMESRGVVKLGLSWECSV